VHGQFQDYPPGYLYLLWLTGKVSAAPGYLLLKLPAVLADLGLAWVAGTFATRIAPARLTRRWPVRTLVTASVLFNPATFGLSAILGPGGLGTGAVVLGALLLLFTGERSPARDAAAFLLFAIAFAMKPQVGVVLPVMLYALYRRYLYRRARAERLEGALTIAAVGAPALVLWASSGLAFGLGPLDLARFYRHSASIYPVTSANAFNIWGAAGPRRNDSWGEHVLRIAGVPALYLGIALFLAALSFVLWRVHRALARRAAAGRVLTTGAALVGRRAAAGPALTTGAALVALLAFLTLTRMHERYLFLSLACLAPLVVDRRCGVGTRLCAGCSWSTSGSRTARSGAGPRR
jgi:Gpi18-like mannosyltransferase